MNENILNPDHSPNSESNHQVRRLNKRPMFIIMVILVFTMICITYAIQQRQQQDKTNTENLRTGTNNLNSQQMANQIISGVEDGIIGTENNPPTIITDNNLETTPPNNTSPAPYSPQSTTTIERDLEAERIEKMVKEFRERNFYDAVISRTAIDEPIPQITDNNNYSGNNNNNNNGSNDQMAYLLNQLAQQGIYSNTLYGQDPNLQQRKEQFANNQQNPYHYSSATRTPQLTPYEIRVGTIIPAVMISGINSDLPGDIIAQVSQDVRDSKTGRYILIPQGSKLIGKYDSQIAMGQERVMIAWYRIQFPDASTLDLDNMGAVDLAGYAGMKDQVNNHTWRIFKNAFLLSMIGAGTQIAIGDSSNDENSPINVTKSEMGRQFGQLGTEMIRRNMNIQPTLEIRPGYRFNVMVNKDIILTPYKDK